ncbi:unnamed protein product [marine sediment metagenome]|uniref:Uncharacterized protein n=1 Tax=marine sediment metagenome TaxID=412755 RepID=X1FNH9_9ZZZZ
MAANVSWLIKQWDDVLTKQQFVVSKILQYLIADTVEALKELEELKQRPEGKR